MVYILCKINELCNFEIYSTYTFAYCQVYFTSCQVSAQWHIVQRASLCSVGLYWLRKTDMLISINKKKMSAFLEQQPFLTTHLFVCTTRQIGKVIFVSPETRHGGTFIKSCKLFPWPKKKDITYWLQEFWWSRNCIQFERRPMQWSDCCGQSNAQSVLYQRIVYLSRRGSHFSLYYLVGAKKSAIFRQSSDMSKLRAVKCWNHGICWLEEFWLVVRVPGLIQQNWTLDICRDWFFWGKKPDIYLE